MHPDEIVAAQQWQQALGELLVDAAIGVVMDVPVLERADEIVEQRPQAAVAEPGVVGGVVLAGQVEGRIGDVAPVDDRAVAGRAVHEVPAPAEPQSAAGAHRGQHADREPACGRRAARRGDPVRDGHQPPHSASSTSD